MPGTLQLLIGARLDTLAAEEKALLQDAAVVGKVFWAGVLSAMAGLVAEEVVARLHEAVQREFIRPVRTSSVGGQSEYAFLHSLVQEVAYGQIPRAARAAKHVAVARWIREVAGDRVFDMAEVLSHHYGEALELTRTAPTGLDVAELESSAGSALMMAGDRAKRLDPLRAIGFFRRAREVLPANDPERIRALLEAAEAGEDIGRFEEARADFERAIDEAAAAGDDLTRGEAMARMGRSVALHGDAARGLLEEGIGLLETREPGPELARAYGRMAGHLYVAGDNAAAIGLAEKALALADELGLEGEVVLDLQYRGAARGQLGDAGGLEDLREALRRAKEIGLGNETAIAYNNFALQLWLWEGPSAALVVWDEMAAFCRVRGFQTLSMWARGGSLEALFDIGEWDRILQIAEEMLAWHREHGATRVGITALTYQAWVHVRRGGYERAAEILDELVPRAREVGYAEYLGPVLVIASEVSLARGDTAAAVRFVDEFVEVTQEQEDYRTMFLPVAQRVLVKTGSIDRAEELLESGSPTSSRNRLAVLSARAIVAEAGGDLETAAGLYREAAVRWGEYRFNLECALVSLGAARCLIGLGRELEEAERLLEEARRTLSRLGARPLLDEIEDLLGRGAVRAS
jgi:tetratricopeptide (TPR) repeat protein